MVLIILQNIRNKWGNAYSATESIYFVLIVVIFGQKDYFLYTLYISQSFCCMNIMYFIIRKTFEKIQERGISSLN